MVYPLVTIPEWVAGRVFYDLLGRVATYLLLPLLFGYAVYRIVAYLIAVSPDGSQSTSLWESYATLPGVQSVFGEIAWDALLLVSAFVLFFLAVRRAATRAIDSGISRIPGEAAPSSCRARPRTGSRPSLRPTSIRPRSAPSGGER